MQTGQLEHELKQTLEGEVRFDPYSRAMYSTDASIYQIEPIGVVIPRSREDVIAAVELSSRYGVPVLPRGGGTSLAGQTVGHAIILDMSKYMNRVLEVNTEERWARVQPGIVLEHLNHEIRNTGLFFTPDPATSNRSNVGGAIGNNSCGSHSIVYGKTIDHIIEVDTVLSNGEPARLGPLTPSQLETRLHGEGLEGEIYRRVRDIARANAPEVDERFPKVMRRVGGYNLDEIMEDDGFNLAKMIVGSEGTLATITEVKVNLEPRPAATALMAVHFSGLIEAMEATVSTLEFRPAAVELVGRVIIQQINASLGYRRRSGFIEGDPHSILLVETAGDSEAEVGARLEEIERSLRRGGMGYAFIKMFDRAEQANVWDVRKAGIGLMMGVKSAAKPIPFIEDCAVHTDRLPEYIQRVDDLDTRERHGSRVLRPRKRRLHPRAAVHRPQGGGGRGADVSNLTRRLRPGDGNGRRNERRARRRPGAKHVERTGVWHHALQRIPRGQACLRPKGHHEPRQDCGRAVNG